MMKTPPQRRNRFAGYDCPVGFTRHRLYGIDTKGEQNGTKEDIITIAVEYYVVMENVQPAWQFEAFNAFLARERRATL